MQNKPFSVELRKGILGGGPSWTYLLVDNRFVTGGAAHESDKPGMAKLQAMYQELRAKQNIFTDPLVFQKS